MSTAAQRTAPQTRKKSQNYEAEIESIRADISELTNKLTKLTKSGVNDAKVVASQKAEEAGELAKEQIAELEEVVRRKPIQSALVAAGIGFVVALIARR